MNEFITLKDIDQVAAQIKKTTSYKPQIGIILGSGLGPFANSVQEADKIPYAEIPGWPISTVEGHVGQLVIGNLAEKQVLIMQGRAHFYEGYGINRIGLPVRVMRRLGVEILIVTNAAGGVNPDFVPGDVMLIEDHLNLLGMAGQNPLIGPNLSEFGTRFPDMSQAYDRGLMSLACDVAQEERIALQEGVYVCLSGPTFETPADLRFLRAAGVDAVGMSTVPEVIIARHSGMRVLGFSGISNKANLDGNTVTTHEEVLEAGRMLVPKLTAIISGVISKV